MDGVRCTRALLVGLQRWPPVAQCMRVSHLGERENDFVDRRGRRAETPVSRQFMSAGPGLLEERDPDCVTVRAKQGDDAVSWERGGDCRPNRHDRIGNLGATRATQHCLRNCALVGGEITAKKNALAANKITARPSGWSLLRPCGPPHCLRRPAVGGCQSLSSPAAAPLAADRRPLGATAPT